MNFFSYHPYDGQQNEFGVRAILEAGNDLSAEKIIAKRSRYAFLTHTPPLFFLFALKKLRTFSHSYNKTLRFSVQHLTPPSAVRVVFTTPLQLHRQ